MAGEQQLTQWEPGIDWMNRYSNLLRKGRDYLNVYTGKHVGDAVFGGSPELVRGVAPTMNKIAGYLQEGTDFLNKAKVPEGVPLVGGAGVGDLTLGGAAKGLEHLSYGGSPFEGRGQTLKLRDDVFDAAMLGASAIPAVKGLASGAPLVAKEAARQLPGMVERTAGRMVPGGENLVRPPAIDIWHGSPYYWPSVDPNKVGRGMGDQVYGHGFYGGEMDLTGDRYRRMISGRQLYDSLTKAGEKQPGMKKPPTDDDIYRTVMNDPKVPADQKYLLYALKNEENRLGFGSTRKALGQFLANPSGFETSEVTKRALNNFGFLYKIDFPDKYARNLLDWNKGFLDQERTLEKLGRASGIKKNIAIRESMDLMKQMPREPTGADFMDALVNKYNPKAKAGIRKRLASELEGAGIFGVRYDEPHHGWGSNYVVFPEAQKTLTVKEINRMDPEALRQWWASRQKE